MASKIILVSLSGENREHTIEHAQRIMDYQKAKGFSDWSIAEDQPYELKDGTISPRDKDENHGASGKNRTSARDTK